MKITFLLLLLLLWDDVGLTETNQEITCELPASNPQDPIVKVPEGSRITLQCQSEGSSRQVQCLPSGRWDSFLCPEVSCSTPPSENFVVEGEEINHRQDDTLRYTCDRGYRKVDARPSRCKKVGQTMKWSPPPQCEPATCRVLPDMSTGTWFSPGYKNIFRFGEKVTVSCGDKMWIKDVLQQSAELTCQDDGEWDFHPVCQRVECSRATQNISRWGSYWRTYDSYLMDDTVSYQCQTGLDETSLTKTARCTRQGWEPNPLCKEPLGCGTPPSLKNGDFLSSNTNTNFEHKTGIEYHCQARYTMQGKPYKTCLFGEWIGDEITCLKPCTVTQDQMEANNIEFKFSSTDKLYLRDKDFTTFICVRGTRQDGVSAMRQQCINGEIDLPRCIQQDSD